MDALFHERQRFRQKWLWLLVIGVLVIPVGVIAIDPKAPDGAVILAVALGAFFLWMLYVMGLSVAVTRAEIVVRFYPFHLKPRRIAFREIAEAYARRYKPIMDYGGWGIRYGVKGWAWNVSGDEGVQLVLKDGKRILIGSQRSAELERAIQAGLHS